MNSTTLSGEKFYSPVHQPTATLYGQTTDTENDGLNQTNFRISDFFYSFVKVTELFTTNAEPLEKVIKNSYRAFDIVAKVQKVTDSSITILSSACKGAAEVLESIRVFGALRTLVVPQENKRYFLADPKYSIQKKCDRTLLLGHTSCKTIRSLNKWKLIDLGTFGKLKIGNHLTVFNLVTDVLMIGSSAFGIWDNIEKLKENAEQLAEFNRKIEKWEERPLTLALIASGDLIEIEKFKSRSQGKVVELKGLLEVKQKELHLNQDLLANQTILKNQEQAQALAKDVSKIQKEMVHLQKKLEKNESRLQHMSVNDFTSVVNEMAKKEVSSKIDNIQEEKADHLAKDFTILKIASSVAKIFVISLAITLTAFNFWTLLPSITLLAAGIFADTLGLIKFYKEKGPKTS